MPSSRISYWHAKLEGNRKRDARNRRALRKAGHSGVTTRISTSWDAMLVFHRLHLATRRRHGVPPQPLAFFRNIQREILASGHGFIVIAEPDPSA